VILTAENAERNMNKEQQRIDFIKESNRIEGIRREPTAEEFAMSRGNIDLATYEPTMRQVSAAVGITDFNNVTTAQQAKFFSELNQRKKARKAA
jgi:hypothetical protein